MGKSNKRRVCVGFGDKIHECEETAGTRWTPHYCKDCDKKRRDSISKSLEDIIRKMKPTPDRGTP